MSVWVLDFPLPPPSRSSLPFPRSHFYPFQVMHSGLLIRDTLPPRCCSSSSFFSPSPDPESPHCASNRVGFCRSSILVPFRFSGNLLAFLNAWATTASKCPVGFCCTAFFLPPKSASSSWAFVPSGADVAVPPPGHVSFFSALQGADFLLFPPSPVARAWTAPTRCLKRVWFPQVSYFAAFFILALLKGSSVIDRWRVSRTSLWCGSVFGVTGVSR